MDATEATMYRQSGFIACSAITARWINRIKATRGAYPTAEEVLSFILNAAELYDGCTLVVGGVEAEKLTRAAAVRA